MRKTRWSWYLLMSGIAVVSAEGLSWSTPVIFPINPFVLVIYGRYRIDRAGADHETSFGGDRAGCHAVGDAARQAGFCDARRRAPK